MAKEPENGPKRRLEHFMHERLSGLKPREGDRKESTAKKSKDVSGTKTKVPNGSQGVREHRQRQWRKRSENTPDSAEDSEAAEDINEQKEKEDD